MIIKRILFIIVLSFSFFSCINSIDGNGTVKSENRVISSFNKIDISGGYEVFLTQGEEEKLELEVDENLLELIESEVKNNVLYISSKKPLGSAKSLKIYVTVTNIEDIHVSGAIQLKNKGTFTGNELSIDVSGAADIDLDINVEDLNMKMSGASETSISGKSENFKIKISGAGDLDAKKLKCSTVQIKISGAGSAIVHAKKSLKVDISGAGSVKYKGNPKIEKDISGAGSIEKL